MKNNIAKLIASAALATIGAAAVQAQQIHILTPRISNGSTVLYEVLPGAPGGGQFINQPRYAGIFYCNGYTDRIARGETYYIWVEGSGAASEFDWCINQKSIVRNTNVSLPHFEWGQVSMSPSFSNVDLKEILNGRTYWLHFPIGSR